MRIPVVESSTLDGDGDWVCDFVTDDTDATCVRIAVVVNNAVLVRVMGGADDCSSCLSILSENVR